ncbi:MAG: hypothetical protein HQL24_01180 [Candidatus Omnitrophica bacterium]|nr:hypothetical protein [Candidatus Omnitrophota bacterium]
MSKFFKQPKFLLTIVCLLAVSLSLSGCETLRKKFTRKKKEDEESTVMPILEPIEYPANKESSQEKYTYHYSLWKGWYKDLVAALDDNENDKRVKYLLTETMTQLEEMTKLLKGEKQALLTESMKDWVTIEKEFDAPSALRNTSRIKQKLSSQEKFVRDNFGVKAKLEYISQ